MMLQITHRTGLTVLMDKLERVTDRKRSRRKSFQVVLVRPLVIEVRPGLPHVISAQCWPRPLSWGQDLEGLTMSAPSSVQASTSSQQACGGKVPAESEPVICLLRATGCVCFRQKGMGGTSFTFPFLLYFWMQVYLNTYTHMCTFFLRRVTATERLSFSWGFLWVCSEAVHADTCVCVCVCVCGGGPASCHFGQDCCGLFSTCVWLCFV